jgi:hypothetical protein
MMESEEENKPDLGGALSNSIGSGGVDLITASGDALIDKLISSGAIDGIPIIGILSSGFKAAREARDHLYLRQIVKFLMELKSTSEEDRTSFVCGLKKKGELERFGENVLLILSRVDDGLKPRIIGRLMAAHISGKIKSYTKTIRLVAIVNRVYAEDLNYLRSFKPGLQKDDNISASLFAAGLLANTGIDGGGADQEKYPGGYTYELNEYAELLLEYGLK